MKKLIVITLLGMAMTVADAGTTKETAQNVGVGSGAIVGGLVGGPVGLILGAAIGGHYADTLHRSTTVPGLEQELQQARSERDQSQTRIARLNTNLFETRGELDKLSAELSGLLLERAAFEGLQMEVLYQTANSTLTDDAADRLTRLGDLLQKMPDMTVRLDGYADPRGDEVFNEDLSRQRAESVRDALVAAGINMERIAIHAHGEAAAIPGNDNLDAYALERKVRVRLLGTTDGTRVALDN